MVVVNVSSVIRSATGGQSSISLNITGTIETVLSKLVDEFGEGFKNRIYQNGHLRKYINVYLNGVDIRYLNELSSHVNFTDTIDLIPAVSGG